VDALWSSKIQKSGCRDGSFANAMWASEAKKNNLKKYQKSDHLIIVNLN